MALFTAQRAKINGMTQLAEGGGVKGENEL